jgi:hypothetical protein
VIIGGVKRIATLLALGLAIPAAAQKITTIAGIRKIEGVAAK